MATKIGTKALIHNPALKPFERLVGEWQTTGSHPYMPGVALHGRSSFEWMEGGAFLMMHSEIAEPNVPDGIAVFGSDDGAKTFYMLYFDERGISRKYDVSISQNELKWWRDDPGFSQRFTVAIESGANRMTAKGEMSRDGRPWEDDLSLTFERVK